MLVAGAAWLDMQGVQRRLTLNDVLSWPPTTRMSRFSRRRCPGARGWAPSTSSRDRRRRFVIYSMATSTDDDAPRGMEFLYSLHRLNVARSSSRPHAGL